MRLSVVIQSGNRDSKGTIEVQPDRRPLDEWIVRILWVRIAQNRADSEAIKARAKARRGIDADRDKPAGRV
jgi:hypothetical protein